MYLLFLFHPKRATDILPTELKLVSIRRRLKAEHSLVCLRRRKKKKKRERELIISLVASVIFVKAL